MYKLGRYDLSLRCPAAPAACCMMGVWELVRAVRSSGSSCLAVCSAFSRGRHMQGLTGQAVQGSQQNKPFIKSYGNRKCSCKDTEFIYHVLGLKKKRELRKNDWKFVPSYLDQQNVRRKPRVILFFIDSIWSASFYVKKKETGYKNARKETTRRKKKLQWRNVRFYNFANVFTQLNQPAV